MFNAWRWLVPWLTALPTMAAAPTVDPVCGRLVLPVVSVVPPPLAYREFCQANPGHCAMSGLDVVPWSSGLAADLVSVNQAVNAQIRFMPDAECTGQEEVWGYPVKGVGDCEDFALEKRRRLVALGLPRAALTMAIVHHRTRWFSHAVLLAETSRGSFVLDNLTDEVACWTRAPYHFETRERPDGQWARFDQRGWYSEAPASGPGAAAR